MRLAEKQALVDQMILRFASKTAFALFSNRQHPTSIITALVGQSFAIAIFAIGKCICESVASRGFAADLFRMFGDGKWLKVATVAL